MSRRLALVAVITLACTNSGPSVPAESAQQEPAAPVPAAPVPAAPVPAAPIPAEPRPVEPAAPAEPVAPGPATTPWFVSLGGDHAHTKKPARNVVLGHSWGWGTATEATIAECERVNDGQVGKMMWCSTEDKPEGAADLIEERKLKPGRSVAVSHADVAGWNVAPPAGPVWLIGPKQACKAEVGRPLVGYYSIDADGGTPEFEDHFMILELAWELTGCDKATSKWAPIGVVDAAFDETLRWVAAQAGPRERFDPATSAGPLASELIKLPDAANVHLAEEERGVVGSPDWWVQRFELPGSDVGELFAVAAWRGTDSQEKKPGEYGCDDHEFGSVLQYRREGDGQVVIGRGSRGELVGGLVNQAGKAHTLVWTDTLSLSVAQVGARELSASVALSTGGHHPEDGGVGTYSLIGYCGP